jgi:ABC-type transporter Mla subunit MlaD
MKLDTENMARLLFAAVLLLGAAFGAGWYFLSSSRYATYQIYTHDPVSGLIADAPVEYHGVDIGRVKRVELVDARSVRILLRVERTAPITTATVATIITRGLAARGFTGYVYVSLEETGAEPSPGPVARSGEDPPVIPLTQPKSASLDTAIARMDENVQRLTERFSDVLDGNTVASLKQSVDNLQRVTTTLSNNNAKLNALIDNGLQASRELKPLLESSNRVVDTLHAQILPETHGALVHLEELNRQLQPLVDSSNDTLDALKTQVLPQTYKTLTDLDQLSTSLGGFARKVNKDPSVIVRGAAPVPFGPGEAR